MLADNGDLASTAGAKTCDRMIREPAMQLAPPEKMAFYTELPDSKAFNVLWKYLDASEDSGTVIK